MKITRRHILATITAATVLGASGMAQAADTVRIGLPTKTYWPTTIAETAVRQKLFEKEGITAELTIYRGGAETFEAMAAGAADVILDATSLVSAGRKKGVNSKVLASAATGYYGWQLMTLSKSTLGVNDLKGSQVRMREQQQRLNCRVSSPEDTTGPRARKGRREICQAKGCQLTFDGHDLERRLFRLRREGGPKLHSFLIQSAIAATTFALTVFAPSSVSERPTPGTRTTTGASVFLRARAISARRSASLGGMLVSSSP